MGRTFLSKDLNSNRFLSIFALVIRTVRFCLAAYLGVLLSGCTTWGTKVPMGDQHYPSVRTEHVVILFDPPSRPYQQIGVVSSLGGWYTTDGDNYHKMQMAAAQLGADAVIVRGEESRGQRDY